ncbi:MAG TPA: AraC family transcriptional regulator, partial [Myxococcota bacterium]
TLLPGDGHPSLPVRAGDVWLATTGIRRIASAADVDGDADVVPAAPLFSRRGLRDHVRIDDDDDDADDDARIVTGRIAVDVDHAALLLDVLPPVVKVAGPTLQRLIAILDSELDLPNAAGHAVAVDAVALGLLVQVLRSIDDVGSATGTGRRATRGWLRGLGDPQIGAVLRVLHKDVAARPDLHDLAGTAGMSRSAFAARFTQLVGESPHAYAIRWRMTLAKDALRTTSTPIGSIGFALGYESESAFSAAFKREVGVAPRAFREDVAP